MTLFYLRTSHKTSYKAIKHKNFALTELNIYQKKGK